MGIEPTSKAWEAFVLPLNYARLTEDSTTDSPLVPPAAASTVRDLTTRKRVILQSVGRFGGGYRHVEAVVFAIDAVAKTYCVSQRLAERRTPSNA